MRRRISQHRGSGDPCRPGLDSSSAAAGRRTPTQGSASATSRPPAEDDSVGAVAKADTDITALIRRNLENVGQTSVPVMRQSTERSCVGSVVHRRMSRGHAGQATWRRKLRWVPAQRGGGGRLSCGTHRSQSAEISDRPRRRFVYRAGEATHSQEADQAAGTGEIGAILRRHGLLVSFGRGGAVGGRQEPGRPDTGEAWAEGTAPGRSAGHRTGLLHKEKTPSSSAVWSGPRASSTSKNFADLLRSVGADRARDRARQHALTEGLASAMPVKGTVSATCAALGLSRASLQRSTKRQSRPPTAPLSRPSPARALPAGSRQTVLDLLSRSPRFADLAPAEIYATFARQGASTTARSAPYGQQLLALPTTGSRPPQATSPSDLHETGITGGVPQ